MKFRVFIIAILVVAGGVLGIEGVTALWNAHTLHSSVSEVTTYYKNVVESADALMKQPDATLSQKEMFADVQRIAPRIQVTASTVDQRAAVAELQQVLAQILAYAGQNNETISSLPAFEELRNAVDRHGEVRPLIDAYNERANAWNNRCKRKTAWPIVTLFGLEPIPLLGFDGEVQYQMTIGL